MNRRIWERLGDLLTLMMAVGLLCLVLASMASDLGTNWMLQLTAQFRYEYLLAAALMLVWFLSARRWVLAIVATGVILVNLAVLGPYFLPMQTPKTPLGRTIKVVQFNMLYDNHRVEDMMRYMQEHNPDIVALEEFNQRNQRQFEQTGIPVTYPYHLLYHNEIGLYSRFPLTRHPNQLSAEGYGVIIADTTIDQQPVTLVVAHVMHPFGYEYHYHLDFLNLLARHRNQLKENVIILGDFNSVAWTEAMRYTLAKMGLRDSMQGYGIQLSWPSMSRLNMVVSALPIDQCFVSHRFHVLRREVGPDIGSDHLPVYLELGLAREAGRKNHFKPKPEKH